MDRIVRYQITYPGRPVFLVGQSGGAAIAAWAAESMPWDRKIEGIVMIAPALSPQYKLDRALLGCHRGIVNFHSARDRVLLGFGTTVAGTMDGEHTASAGKNGFEVPDASRTPGGRPGVYDNLFQVAWNKRMSDTGNTGWHLSSGAVRFVTAYVAPLIRAGAWNGETLSRVLNREEVEVPQPPDWRPQSPPSAGGNAVGASSAEPFRKRTWKEYGGDGGGPAPGGSSAPATTRPAAPPILPPVFPRSLGPGEATPAEKLDHAKEEGDPAAQDVHGVSRTH
jgi:pimeloyl-ACP methyl ester carboxylesterase